MMQTNLFVALIYIGCANFVSSQTISSFVVSGLSPADDICNTFNSNADGTYWDEVQNCTSCAAAQECGFCLSTLQCVAGDALGPLDGSPCPSWVAEPSVCPIPPTCGEYDSCSSCASADDCAWCASENTCLTVSEVFSQNCRGTVFDVPCPASFVGVNRVIGNLVVEQDPIFGGGHLEVSGSTNYSSNKFRLTVNSTEATLKSANKIELTAGDNNQINTPGGSVSILAGAGTSLNRGAGGQISLQAGHAHGVLNGGGAVLQTLRTHV